MNVNQTQVAMNSYSINVKAEYKSKEKQEGKKLTAEQEQLQKDIRENKITAKDISNTYLFEFNMEIKTITMNSSTAQGMSANLDKVKELLKGINAGELGYTGKPLQDLSPEEAKALVADDGFFGVSKTAERIADFVINGSGTDLERLKSGREGMLRGFADAEEMWGEKLPDIAYETIKKATEKVDKRIEELGGSVLNIEA